MELTVSFGRILTDHRFPGRRLLGIMLGGSLMLYPDSTPIARMTEPQRAWFYAEFDRARRDEVAGVLLAIFLGGLGIHHFYLGRTVPGVIYLVFSWTGIPTILGWIECFFMPSRVREYNAMQAAMIASQILSQPSPQLPTNPYGAHPA